MLTLLFHRVRTLLLILQIPAKKKKQKQCAIWTCRQKRLNALKSLYCTHLHNGCSYRIYCIKTRGCEKLVELVEGEYLKG